MSSRAIDGPTGIGWTSSVVSRLYYATYLFSAPSTYQKLAYIVLPGGLQWTFVDVGNGTFTPPHGRHDTLVHNGDNTWDLTLQGSRSKLHFSVDGSLLSLIDDYGNTLNVTYDGNGRVQRIADAAGSGRYLDVIWGPDGRISTVRDHTGRQVLYAYNGQGALTTVTDTASRVTTHGYTTGRFGPLLNQIKDHWNRVVTDITYDSKWRTASYTENGETWTYTYGYGGNPSQVSKTDSSNNLAVFVYDSYGMITDRTPPWTGYANTNHTLYYADGSIQQLTDGIGIKTYFTYDSQGGLLTVTRDYQGTSAIRFDYTYDPNFAGRTTAITPKDPSSGAVNLDWQAWQYEYYQTGSPAPGALFKVKRVKNDGFTLETLTTYEYSSKGQVTKHTSATAGVTDYGYDAQNNLHTVTLPANNDGGTRPVITYGYDSLGRVTSVIDALNHQTTYGYDALDRITSVVLPKPSPSSTLNFTTTYSYDNFDSPSGLVFTNVTDPNAKVAKQGYDQFGQLVQSIDASNNLTRYTYTKGLLTSITDANNNVTSYGYDAARRLNLTTFPDSTTEQDTYWADSSLQNKTDRKGTGASYAYDPLKRITQKTFAPFGGYVTYTYVGQKLTQVYDSVVPNNETHTLTYDASYRVAGNTQASRGTVNYLYNVDDTVQNYSVQSGPSATYTYYPDGSLNTIVWSPVAGNFKYRYTLPGQYQSVTFPSNTTRNFTYDDQGRLTNLTNLNSGGTNRATYAYGYDYNYTTGQNTMLGQRSSMTATVPAQGLSNHLFKYEYDSVYELNKVTYPNVAPFSGEVDSWTYDAIGNRTSQTINAATTNYTYQKIGSNPLNWQRLLNDGVNAYTYDNNGNTLTRTGYTFGWGWGDSGNPLTSVSGGVTASYAYDYQGRRASKTVGASTSTYLYDGLNLIQETGATPADYLFGPGIDEPLAMRRGGSTYYYGVDGLGSATLVTNSSFVVQNSYLYDAWGTTRSQTGTVVNPFGYTSRELGEAGTLFYRARYLSPAIGRFLSEDPLRNSGDVNWYRYAMNEPLDFGDPVGLQIACRLDPCKPIKRGYDETKTCSEQTTLCSKCFTCCEAAYRYALCKGGNADRAGLEREGCEYNCAIDKNCKSGPRARPR